MLVSPLRYPGGKAKLFPYFVEVVKTNQLFRSTYCEPYAGGAGLALRLLSTGFVERIALNDIDEAIFSFWDSVLHRPDNLCALIDSVPATMDEWYRQRTIWQARNLSNRLELGFSAYFLNRTNRSGIIEGAGPIGGYQQESVWKLDARMNRAQQIRQIQDIQLFKDRISFSNEDALIFTRKRLRQCETFCYLDPPYYVKGSKLYRNFYRHENHEAILRLLREHRCAKWIVSYDDVPQIRDIYSEFAPVSYALNYSAGRKTTGREVIYFSDAMTVPTVEGFELAA